MANPQVNDEARFIEECCQKIENMNSAEEIRQEVQKIKECCNKMEQSV
jgi:hypothetical protein